MREYVIYALGHNQPTCRINCAEDVVKIVQEALEERKQIPFAYVEADIWDESDIPEINLPDKEPYSLHRTPHKVFFTK